MAISTDAAIDVFGTEDEVTVGTPGAVNDGAFSADTDVSDWTNDDDAPFARFKFKVTATSLSGAPTAGKGISVYARLLNIESTEDAPTPDTSYPSIYLCFIRLDAADANQVHASPRVRLPNLKTSQEYEFFIKNESGVNFASGAGAWQLWVTPMSIAPHA